MLESYPVWIGWFGERYKLTKGNRFCRLLKNLRVVKVVFPTLLDLANGSYGLIHFDNLNVRRYFEQINKEWYSSYKWVLLWRVFWKIQIAHYVSRNEGKYFNFLKEGKYIIVSLYEGHDQTSSQVNSLYTQPILADWLWMSEDSLLLTSFWILLLPKRTNRNLTKP